MDLQIRGNGIPVNDDLREFALKRAAKLDRLVGCVVDAKLELRHRHNRVGPDTVTAQLTIQTGRRLLRAEEDDPDARAAVDRAVNKLDRQIRRFRDKRGDHKGPRPEPAIASEVTLAIDTHDVEELDEADAERRVVVRTKRFALKPMDVDEAIDQMELLGHDFYLFHNDLEDGPNVVYRRRDGAYGLLAPDRG
ncbi:MAG: ribosome-associated translation inhibitor RaiA [Chloroflexota bacterium]|nr:ribosome-associated translation inhibitor RaiA [Chloroflexota bacterium]